MDEAEQPTDPETTAPGPPTGVPDGAPHDAAGRLGGALGRLARVARETAAGHGPEREQIVSQAQAALDAAKPHAERLVRETKAAAEAAKPHVERAAREAARYTRDHQDDIRRVASTGAGQVARRTVPPALRPIADLVEQELRPHPTPPEAAPSSTDAPAEGDAPPPAAP